MMSSAQRKVLVVALGVVAAVGAVTVNRLMSTPSDGGWFAYAPNTDVVFAPRDDSHIFREAAVWLVAVVAWAVPSFWLLRDRSANEDRSSG